MGMEWGCTGYVMATQKDGDHGGDTILNSYYIQYLWFCNDELR